MDWQLRFLRKKHVLVFIALVSACTTMPVHQNAVRVTGFWEQDENTDPRFVRFDRPSGVVIGTLRVAGNNVYLNDRKVTATLLIENNSHLRTGPRSGARVEFDLENRGFCDIGILNLYTGRGYGNTAQCRHQMGMPQGNGLTNPGTIYHVAMNEWQTEITVIRGQLEAWLNRDPLRRVVVTRAQEVLLTPDEIIGPRVVSQAEVERRTGWRSKFTFDEPAPVDNSRIESGIKSVIKTGIGIGFKHLLGELLDRGKEPPTDEPTIKAPATKIPATRIPIYYLKPTEQLRPKTVPADNLKRIEPLQIR
jgi:hypothetical protein